MFSHKEQERTQRIWGRAPAPPQKKTLLVEQGRGGLATSGSGGFVETALPASRPLTAYCVLDALD